MKINADMTKIWSNAKILTLFETNDFTAANTSTALHRLARIRKLKPVAISLHWRKADVRLEHLTQYATDNIHDFDARGLANSAWAVAKLGDIQASWNLLAAVAEAAPPLMWRFTAKELSMMTWGFATAGFPAPELFEVIAKEARKTIVYYNPQDIANMTWAFV
ncbi:hypothetical protein M885DRAFT_261888 [Pelagophyceae sp. CCMP2097]|nr:hypothetical protein M885DRAFT_261888 [Pelagophyceae sp. CCMP2097]